MIATADAVEATNTLISDWASAAAGMVVENIPVVLGVVTMLVILGVTKAFLRGYL